MTFRHAEYFTFKSIDDKSGANYATFTLAHQALATKIDPHPTIFNPADHAIHGYSHDDFMP